MLDRLQRTSFDTFAATFGVFRLLMLGVSEDENVPFIPLVLGTAAFIAASAWLILTMAKMLRDEG